jgi:hypothetical protein
MSPAKFFAYHVDLRGITKASYELQASDDSDAASEARYFLKFHPSIEVWQGARWIARLTHEVPAVKRNAAKPCNARKAPRNQSAD